MWLDTDLNHATGGVPVFPGSAQSARARGPEYRIRMQAGIDPVATLDLLSVTQGQVSVSALPATNDHGWTVTADRRLLGGPGAFDFFVLAGLYESDRPEWVDDAPDVSSGTWGWRYDTGLPPLAPPKPMLTAAARPTLAPSPPRAGRALLARLPFTLTNAAGLQTTVRCRATVGGRAIRATRAGLGTSDAAVCAWAVPRVARGKLVRGSVTVTAGNASVVRRFAVLAR